MNAFISTSPVSSLSVPLVLHQQTNVCPTSNPSTFIKCSSFIVPIRNNPKTLHPTVKLGIVQSSNDIVRCDTSDPQTTVSRPGIEAPQDELTEKQSEQQKNIDLQNQWRFSLRPGSIVEAWTHGELTFAVVESVYDRGINTNLAACKDNCSVTLNDNITKISFGEIITVWPDALIAPSNNQDPGTYLVKAIEEGTRFLRHAAPKSINLSKIYSAMCKLPKNNPRSSLTSVEISHAFFKQKPSQTLAERAALAVATATLLAADSIHFKRSQPGHGWRALPPSVTVSRGRLSFIEACNAILEVRRSSNGKDAISKRTMTVWSREQLDILRDLEVVAASGATARGTSAVILETLGYESNDDGAANLLLDINYWTTGKHGSGLRMDALQSGNQKQEDATSHATNFNSNNHNQAMTSPLFATPLAQRQQQQQRERDDMEWTCTPSMLAEARELRAAARERRTGYMNPPGGDQKPGSKPQTTTPKRRRSLLHPREGQAPLRAYCIDDKSTRFLDDAVSVRVIRGGTVVRLWVHIADLDEVIRSGSALDEFARERGQSMYLPLKPLHMLPMAAMDAASFSASYPTEAISVMVECDVESDIILNWEVFASVVPPVTRVNYEQFDLAMEHGAKAAQLDDEALHDLKYISYVAPLLAEKLDLRRSSRKLREMRQSTTSEAENNNNNEKENNGRLSSRSASSFDDKPIAAVRLLKRSDKAGVKGIGRIAKVVNFQQTGSHQVVNELLTCAGGVMRQFARENRAYLPEGRDAFLYAGRCGTAPLRRYSDLAIQRQIKCVLFGRQPAGRRRMDELKVWLAKRQAAAEKTVSERRRGALFESFSSFCAQKCAATGAPRATVRGQVRNVAVTKKGVLRVDVALDGTGLSTNASARKEFEKVLFGGDEDEEFRVDSEVKAEGISKQEWKLRRARDGLVPHTQVQVEIEHVDTIAYTIRAYILRILD